MTHDAKTTRGRAPSYTSDLHDAIDDVDLGAWEEIRQFSAEPFTDPRFLRAIERSMGSQCRLWHVVIRDEAHRPVACTTLSLFRVDLVIVASPGVRRLVQAVRRVFPSFLRFKFVFCGVPVSTGHCNLVMTPAADSVAVLGLLDRVMDEIATREHALFLCHKELSDAHADWEDHLVTTGWLRGDTPPMHNFAREPLVERGYCQPTFDDYIEALSAKRRYSVRASLRKGTRAGITISRVTDPESIRRQYDARLHRLYIAVLERSEHQFEVLPLAFFNELSKQFPDQLALTTVTMDQRVAAFSFSLATAAGYYILFCGIDYDLNRIADLYFNVMYAELGQALSAKTDTIQVGQTADEFKAELGCTASPRSICVRARSRLVTRLISPLSGLLLPPYPPGTARHVYSQPVGS